MLSFILDTLKFVGILFCVLLIFNFIIIVHEWGHFLAARWRGLKIEKFQIWMGKPIWKRTWNGVQYGLGTIPIGGFVQLPQMSPMEAIEGKSDEKREVLPPIKPIDKIIVAFAGPLFSFLLALAFACAVSIVGKPVNSLETDATIGFTVPGMPAAAQGLKAGDKILEIDDKPIKGFYRLTDSVIWAIGAGTDENVKFKIQRPGEPEPRVLTVHAPYKDSDAYKKWDQNTGWWKKMTDRPPLRQVGIAPASEGKIKTVLANSPAATAGIQKGDIIKTINGEKCYNPEYIYQLAKKKPGEPIVLTIQRGDQEVPATIVPRKPDAPKDYETAVTGIMEFEELEPLAMAIDHPAPFTLIGDCFRNTAATFKALFSPSSAVGVSHMSGPVGILNLYYRIFQNPHWWRLVLWFSVVLNVGLAIFNLLPLPVLDGGHITMATLEMVRGKALGTRLLEYVQLVCVLGLLSFVVFVSVKDIGGINEPKDQSGEVKFNAPGSDAGKPATP